MVLLETGRPSIHPTGPAFKGRETQPLRRGPGAKVSGMLVRLELTLSRGFHNVATGGAQLAPVFPTG
jgi:hypothetical protein